MLNFLPWNSEAIQWNTEALIFVSDYWDPLRLRPRDPFGAGVLLTKQIDQRKHQNADG